MIIVSFALSAHLLVVTSYNLVQIGAEELVEKSPFEEFNEKELEENINMMFFDHSVEPEVEVYFAEVYFLECLDQYFGIQREIPIPPPDFI